MSILMKNQMKKREGAWPGRKQKVSRVKVEAGVLGHQLHMTQSLKLQWSGAEDGKGKM